MTLFLVVSLFDIFPVRFTLKDVNEARSEFPGEIKAAVSADIARDLLLNCWRHYCRLLLFPTVESHTSMACPSMILIASGTVATSVGDEL